MMLSRTKKRHPFHLTFYGKWLYKLAPLIILALVFLAARDKIKDFFYFPIKNVKVYGIQHSDRDTIQTVLTPFLNKGFFNVDVDVIQDRLQQSTWVSHASVRRIWPDQVLINLEEKMPFARWNNNSLLSASGELFDPEKIKVSETIPEFYGPDGEHLHMMQYYKKLNALLAPLRCKIARLELTSGMAWKLTFDNGVKVSAGSKDVLTHVGHFVKVYPKIVGDRAKEIDYVDLRYPNGLAVRWKTIT